MVEVGDNLVQVAVEGGRSQQVDEVVGRRHFDTQCRNMSMQHFSFHVLGHDVGDVVGPCTFSQIDHAVLQEILQKEKSQLHVPRTFSDTMSGRH